MAIEIVDFPINSMVIFQFAMLNYQRVTDITDITAHVTTRCRCFAEAKKYLSGSKVGRRPAAQWMTEQ